VKVEVANGIEELKRQFNTSAFNVQDDGNGGAHVFIETVSLGPRYRPENTWMGFHIPPQYPYADIYPVFISANTTRVDGAPFVAPVNPGHNFRGRPAIQVSRRSGAAQNGLQKVTAKILKVLNFLETMP